MDEISFGKARIILLPVLLGLIIMFFLKTFSIKISFWIWIALFVAILIIVAIWVIFSQITTIQTPSEISSKIKAINQNNVIIVIASVLVIVAGICWFIGINSGDINDPRYHFFRTEDLSDDTATSFRGYDIEGNYTIEDNAIHVVGTCVITRKTNAKLPWIAFDASGGGLVTVDIIDDNLPGYGYEDFKSGRVVITKDNRNYYFKIKGDFYYFYINNNFAESFGDIEGGRDRRERTYKITIKSITPEGVWIDNIESK